MQSKNGLTLEAIKTTIIPYDKLSFGDFEDLQSKIEQLFNNDGYVTVYLNYEVLIGKFEGKNLIFYNNERFEPKYLQKIRIFNENKELYLWKVSEDIFKGRLRVDNQGEEKNVIDAKQILWGTMAETLNDGWSKIYEERGTALIIPFDKLAIDNYKQRIKINTRNYIDYNELGQAGYVDSRFVSFINGNDNILGGK